MFLVSRQIDNHVAGHSLPVLFCFRDGGALVSANEKSRNGGDVAGDCRFTMSLVGSWKSTVREVYVRISRTTDGTEVNPAGDESNT